LRNVQRYYEPFLKPFWIGTAQVFVLPPMLPTGLWPRLPLDISTDLHMECPLLDENQKNRVVPSRNVYGPFDAEMRGGKDLFDPRLIQVVRRRIMFRGQPSGPPPSERPAPPRFDPRGPSMGRAR
jgi:hypothetical protein